MDHHKAAWAGTCQALAARELTAMYLLSLSWGNGYQAMAASLLPLPGRGCRAMAAFGEERGEGEGGIIRTGQTLAASLGPLSRWVVAKQWQQLSG